MFHKLLGKTSEKSSRRNTIRTLIAMGLAGSGLVSFAAPANECPSYQEVADKLQKQYREQLLFSGFGNTDDRKTANAIFEFWGNPEQGNWSLVAHKLVLFQYQGRETTRECAFVMNAGKQHSLIAGEAIQTAANSTPSQSDPSITSAHNQSCVPRSLLAHKLAEHYAETPVLQALANDNAIVEIFGSSTSWTITRAKIGGVTNPLTGQPIIDVSTGQEVHQVCSTVAFSGKSWGLLDFEHSSI